MGDELDKMADDLFEELMKQAEEDGEELYDEGDLYEFEYQYMPALAATDWADSYSRDVCLGDTSQILDNAMEQDIFIDFINFNASRYRTDGLEVYVYDFPNPPRTPFALYGVIICGNKGARYYTLEQSNGCYMFCNPEVGAHNNYGSIDKISKEEFVKLAIDHYNGVIHLGNYIQFDLNWKTRKIDES